LIWGCFGVEAEEAAEEDFFAGEVAFDVVAEELEDVSADETGEGGQPEAEDEEDWSCQEAGGDADHVEPKTRRMAVAGEPIVYRFPHDGRYVA